MKASIWLKLSFFGIFLSVFAFWYYLNTPVNTPSAPTFIFPPGRSLTGFARDLKDQGYLTWTWPLILHARLTGKSRILQAGEYHLAGLTPLQILDEVLEGNTYQRQMTIIPGWNLADLRQALQNAEGLIVTTAGMPDKQLLALLDSDTDSLEGLFFPDTYHYQRGMSDLDILRLAHVKMQETALESWRNRPAQLSGFTLRETIILASIVEKETALDADRPLISSVFHNRLQANMKLQTDPTVIFGLGKSFDGNLTRAHLNQPGPYNTYLNKGLPMTPICFPGKASIKAAAHPTQSDYLYFVSRGDGNTEFSKTLHEHHAAVKRYQIKQKASL